MARSVRLRTRRVHDAEEARGDRRSTVRAAAPAARAPYHCVGNRTVDVSMSDSEPADPDESINTKFVETCNKLVREGHLRSADAQAAINGFEAVRR